MLTGQEAKGNQDVQWSDESSMPEQKQRKFIPALAISDGLFLQSAESALLSYITENHTVIAGERWTWTR